jgi:hypothetical protein
MTDTLLAALFPLLGVFLGAWLTRRTEFEKWHRQEKTIAIARYLQHLHETRQNARNAMYDSSSLSALEKNTRAIQAFEDLGKSLALVRLYISEQNRRTLQEVQHNLYLQCTRDGGPAAGPNQISEMLEKIQILLETELSRVPGRVFRAF